MKREPVVGVSLAVLAILALGLLAGFLTWQNRDQLFPASSGESIESEADAAIQALLETAAEEQSEERSALASESPESEDTSETDTSVPASAGKTAPDKASADQSEDAPALPAIWVGDSRTLGMQKAVANSDVYIGAAGEGYHWFVETGLDEMRDAIKAHPKSVVVFNLGVNDYDNLENYMELYESLLAEYPDTHFYFLSVNPIDPEECHNITNEEIADFNAHLKELSPNSYLDSYTQIKAAEIETIDGIHYSQDDYRFIYQYAVEQIAKIEASRAAEAET